VAYPVKFGGNIVDSLLQLIKRSLILFSIFFIAFNSSAISQETTIEQQTPTAPTPVQPPIIQTPEPIKKSVITEDPEFKDESSRSDRFTGGKIEKTMLKENQPDIAITVNVPAFKMTFWQEGKEVITYSVGVGMKKFPISIGAKKSLNVIWNPTWIPPDSDWVHEMTTVKPGEVIKPDDPRNPIGKVKIPLGGGYLIHQAGKITDLGNLVSHGCIRMLKKDLFDLADKINTAYGYPVSKRQTERAKLNKKTLIAKLDPPLPVDINYDTQVVEGGVLHLYPDVYDRKTLTVKNIRKELEGYGITNEEISDKTIALMIKRVSRYKIFTVSLDSIREGRALIDGSNRPLIERPVSPTPKTVIKKKPITTARVSLQ
jgi:lipoprotein-anchoring transpeptidase ErfK/SrfK